MPSRCRHQAVNLSVSLHVSLKNPIDSLYTFVLFQELMKRNFSVEEGDHFTLLNIFTNFMQVCFPAVLS